MFCDSNRSIPENLILHIKMAHPPTEKPNAASIQLAEKVGLDSRGSASLKRSLLFQARTPAVTPPAPRLACPSFLPQTTSMTECQDFSGTIGLESLTVLDEELFNFCASDMSVQSLELLRSFAATVKQRISDSVASCISLSI